MSATFNFRSLSDPIDTVSSGGRLVMHILGALAEFERGLIVERNAGWNPGSEKERSSPRPPAVSGRCTS